MRVLAFVFSCGLAAAQLQTTKAPDTPAGVALQTWLEAFNSGQADRLQAYTDKYRNGPVGAVDATLALRKRSGGYALLEVIQTSPGRLAFRVKELAGAATAVGKIEMTKDDPVTVHRFVLQPVPPDVSAQAMLLQLDDATRAQILDAVFARLHESYVFPELAMKVESDLRARLQAGAYSDPDAESFAASLTKHLQDVTRDKHLIVNFVPTVLLENEKPQSRPADMPQFRAWVRRNNCAFDKVEVLPRNIGYLNVFAFVDPVICGATASAAMAFLGKVDALIVDLRDNGGGDPKMVAFLSTYFFEDPTHLNDIYNRKENTTTQYWTLPYVSGDRLASAPVFLLTSKRTFSAAEGFSYNLKALKRATIVGEVTGGGAHPAQGHRLHDHLQITVPFARSINPITKTNWEGTGVEPDVKVDASEALNTAVKLATERLRKNTY